MVDDNKVSRDNLVRILKASGFKPATATSGEEAIEEISRQTNHSRPYDLVFIDYKMPGINGIEAIEIIDQIGNVASRPAVILTVTSADKQEMQIANKNNVNGQLLIKPYYPSTVLDLVLSTFNFELQSRDHVGDITDSHWHTPISFKRPFSVLVVDDNKTNIKIMTEIIRDMGLFVSSATSGADAIEMVKAELFDIVLMDIQMPEMDGLEATRLIRAEERFRNIPILAMTAHAMQHDEQKSQEAGMLDHLTKPIEPNHLKWVLVKVLTDIHGREILNY